MDDRRFICADPYEYGPADAHELPAESDNRCTGYTVRVHAMPDTDAQGDATRNELATESQSATDEEILFGMLVPAIARLTDDDLQGVRFWAKEIIRRRRLHEPDDVAVHAMAREIVAPYHTL